MKNRNNGIDQNIDYVGTVLWFRDDKGYGFLESESFRLDDGGPRGIFAHYSRLITDEQWKTLAKGQVVNFQVVVTTKGLMAVKIRERKVPFLKATFAGELDASQSSGTAHSRSIDG
jgi:CspA family cold shock protein